MIAANDAKMPIDEGSLITGDARGRRGAAMYFVSMVEADLPLK